MARLPTRIKNQMVPGVEGGVTVHQPSGRRMSIYEASLEYAREGVPLAVVAGQEYGSGWSRDWAAKGPALLGVRLVVARSFEGIHRSNLVGMGILPCQLPEGVSAQIPPIRWFAAAGKVNGGMTGLVRVEARDPQAAQNLRDVLNGLLALGRMQAGSRPELQTALQSITLSGTGSTVELSFALPAELVDLLGAAAKKTTDE